jgi:putative transposase
MNDHPQLLQRRSIRLRGYDYSQSGSYFVTLCSADRQCLFGHIAAGEMRLSPIGRVVAGEWAKSAEIRPEIELDEWIVMPNHIHGIVVITNAERTHGRAPLPVANDVSFRRAPRTLGSFIGGFKAAVTTRVNQMRQTPGVPLWQRNYYEQIVRDDAHLAQIREYIVNNPLRWDLDRENPARMKA